MKRTQKKYNKCTPHYDIFIGIMRKFYSNFDENGRTYADDLTTDEIALLNGYKANTGDSEIGVFQTLGLNSVEFDSRLATYRLASYCIALDNH